MTLAADAETGTTTAGYRVGPDGACRNRRHTAAVSNKKGNTVVAAMPAWEHNVQGRLASILSLRATIRDTAPHWKKAHKFSTVGGAHRVLDARGEGRL